jgi:hypothetical protein
MTPTSSSLSVWRAGVGHDLPDRADDGAVCGAGGQPVQELPEDRRGDGVDVGALAVADAVESSGTQPPPWSSAPATLAWRSARVVLVVLGVGVRRFCGSAGGRVSAYGQGQCGPNRFPAPRPEVYPHWATVRSAVGLTSALG